MRNRLRVRPVVLLVLAVLSASFACAAMVPAPAAASHPCCPKTGDCGQGCVSTAPALQAASIGSVTVAAIAVSTDCDPLPQGLRPDRIAAAETPFVKACLFLKNLQLRI